MMDGTVFVNMEKVYGVYVMNFAVRGIRLVIDGNQLSPLVAFCRVHMFVCVAGEG